MKRLWKILGYFSFGLCLYMLIKVATLVHFLFATPQVDLEKLPTNLIALDSTPGQELLAESKYRDDYFLLEPNFVSQSRRAFCGIASSVIAVNTLKENSSPVTQASIFDRPTREVMTPLKVTFGGMTLAQLNGILQANQLETELIYASDSNLEQFRSLVLDNLNNSQDLVLVNYQRQALDQNGSGHISPIAAYHQPSDRFLIMDVAAYRYPSVWVSSQQLWQGIDSIDSTADRSRGFVIAKNQSLYN